MAHAEKLKQEGERLYKTSTLPVEGNMKRIDSLITKNKPALFIGIPISLISGGMVGVSTIFFDAGKPAIYLYPRKKQKISVWLKIKGIITKSIPDYNNGWYVDVEPSGLINGEYDYLFCETTQDKRDVPNEGWSMESKNIEEWFSNKLTELNFNKKELDEFMDYWMPLLSEVENKYIDIRLFTEEYLDEHMELIIDPKPDRTYRYEFIFNGVDKYKELATPNVEIINRDGYYTLRFHYVPLRMTE